MSRYIDTEAIDWSVVEDAYGSRSEAIVACEILIENQATVDAIKVVRCKNCKHWQKDIDESGIEHINFSKCTKGHYGDGMNFFCSHGERKDYE